MTLRSGKHLQNLMCVCCLCDQEKEMEKQKTLYQQARLHDRGAAEMVLQMISASKGTNTHTHTEYLSDHHH